MTTNNSINSTITILELTVPVNASVGGTGVGSPSIHTIPIAQGALPFHFLGPLTNGQLLIGSTGADPVVATLTAGANITIANSPGGITIAAGGGANLIGTTDSSSPFLTVLGSTGALIATGADNTAVGCLAMNATTAGTDNTAVGYAAFASNTVGAANVAIGSQALNSNVNTGTHTAVGYQALFNQNVNFANTAIGYQAMYEGTSNNNSVAVGVQALFYSNGLEHVALGNGALYYSTTSSWCVAVGHQALYYNTTGVNVGIGYQALYYTTSGTDNTAIGYAALQANVTGSTNTAIGYAALGNASISPPYGPPVGNTAVGYQSMLSCVGSASTAVGYQSMLSTTTGFYNTACGAFSLYSNTTGGNNTAFGYQALFSAQSGNNNTAFGSQAMQNLLSASSFNTAVGAGAMNGTIIAATPSQTTAVGYQALFLIGNVASNTAVGYLAMYSNVTGGSNTSVGAQAMYSNFTGGANTAVGFNTLQANVGGGNNTAVGYQALSNNSNSSANTAFGSQALGFGLTGSNNTAIGFNALSVASASDNTAVGCGALSAMVTGSNNTALGYNTGSSYTGGETNNILIGYTVAGVAGESNQIRIGTGVATACFISGISNATLFGGQPVFINSSSNQLGVATAANGQLLIGNGTGFTLSNLTAGSSITITNGAGAITIASSLTFPLAASLGGTGVSSPTAHTIPIAEGSSSFNFLGPMPNGTVLIGVGTSADPIVATLTPGYGVNIANSAGNITISTLNWNNVLSTPTVMVPLNGYLTNNASQVTLTLPTTASQFSEIIVAGFGTGGWKIAQNAGQNIQFGDLSTTPGTGGSLSSTNQYDIVDLLCTNVGTTWTILRSVGNIQVV